MFWDNYTKFNDIISSIFNYKSFFSVCDFKRKLFGNFFEAKNERMNFVIKKVWIKKDNLVKKIFQSFG